MPRDDISAANQARIATYGPRPVYLVSIGFDVGGGAPWLITSYDRTLTVTGPGDVYSGIGCIVSGIPENRASSTCSITVADADRAVYALSVAQGPDQAVTVYRTWLPDGIIETVPVADLVPVFVGRSGPSIFRLQVVFHCRSNSSVKRAPAVRVDSSWCTRLRPEGTVIAWGTGQITIGAS